MKINNPKKNHNNIKKILKKTRTNLNFLKKNGDFRKYILNDISNNQSILDIGQSMREYSKKLTKLKTDTLDINKFKSYPSIQADLCEKDLSKLLKNKYDVIICLAVLEHCYNPFEAIKNINKLLKKNGKLYGYVPFLFNYHAPKNLKFYDFFRFSKDGVSYLLKEFNEVEIFPVRGKISTLGNMLLGGYWKNFFEKLSVHIFLDKILNDKINTAQTSGFYFIAKK